MKTKRSFAWILVITMMVSLLAGCGGTSTDEGGESEDGSGAQYVWKMALNGSAPGELAYDMATYFKEKVEELTGGSVQIDFYGGNSLGLHHRSAGGHVRRRGGYPLRICRYLGSLHVPGEY